MFPLNNPGRHRRHFRFVNYALITLNFLVFFYELTLGSSGAEIFAYRFGFIPVELTHGVSIDWIEFAQRSKGYIGPPISPWLTLFTAMFIHAGWLHILGNMLYLWVFGGNVEDNFGQFKYILFYLVSGLAAAFIETIVTPSSDVPSVGASGAIAGVLGAYLVLYPLSRIRPIFVRIPVFILLALWFLLQFIRVGSLGEAGAGGVAHVGGFVFGLMIAGVYRLLTHGPG